MTDLGATPGVKIKLIDHADVADKMNAKYGKLYAAEHDQGRRLSRPGQGQHASPTVWNILVTSDKMSDDDAYNIVKTIFDKKADLVAVHKEAAELRSQEPGQGEFADSVASRRAEVLHREGHRDVSGGVNRAHAITAPPRRGRACRSMQ